MKKIVSMLLVIALLFSGQSFKADAASEPVVYWEGMRLVKGQIGKVEILKPINLWKKDSNNKLTFSRVLKPGEQYRVYQYSSAHGGQYGLGGPYFVTNMKGYVLYKTPSKYKLQLVNPEAYRTKLTVGTVTDEKSKIIAPGVVQSQLNVSSSKGKQEIFKLDVDQNASQIAFETSLSKDQMIGFETVSSQANRQQSDGHYVIAGVNGDYFDQNGAPTDLTVHNGEVVTTNITAKAERTIFGVSSDGKAMIGNPDILVGVSVNGAQPYMVNSINKRRYAGHLVLYTPYFASNTMTNELGTEVVLTNLQGTLNGNNSVTATVKEVIVGKGSQPLKDGEYVLSGHGAGSDFLKGIKNGDEIKLSLSYDHSAWHNVKQAIGGRYHLVKNGVATQFNVPGAHPRTAIGIKSTGAVFAVVVDGRTSNSVGVTLSEMATIMKDLGAVEAITFDGGGSSTMVARQPGDSEVSVVNNPSDGRERSVANSLLLVGLWKAGPLHTLLIETNNLTLFAGATYKDMKLPVKGLDKMNNPISVKDPISWSSNVGTFNSDGSFTASLVEGSGIIKATIGSVSGTAPVKITNDLDAIKLTETTLVVPKNESVSIPAAGYLAGKKVVEDPSVFKYTVSGAAGTVNKGIFTAGSQDGVAQVTVSYGSLTTTVKVIVGQPENLVIEDFETGASDWKASGVKYTSIGVYPEKNYVKSGSYSLKVAYDFIGTQGTSGVYAQKSAALSIPGSPTKIGMWVYGDAKGHWLRSQLQDSAGKEVQLDFARNLDWTGWKYVEATIPTGLAAPYKLEIPVRYMETEDSNKNKGQIFIDQISASYK
jgi:hypothetical protein